MRILCYFRQKLYLCIVEKQTNRKLFYIACISSKSALSSHKLDKQATYLFTTLLQKMCTYSNENCRWHHLLLFPAFQTKHFNGQYTPRTIRMGFTVICKALHTAPRQIITEFCIPRPIISIQISVLLSVSADNMQSILQ